MNRQPYCKPPRSWDPKLSPLLVRLTRSYRGRQLRVRQRITSVVLEDADYLQSAVAAGQGVLLTPNHAAHYDAPALYHAADFINQPLFFMTAWQVFAMCAQWEQWVMQRIGCFSVDREGTDRRAYRTAIEILKRESFPLVVFPEGDIYHTTDYVTDFREGAAAVALAAAKRSRRAIVAIPCGIKFWYVDSPVNELENALSLLEARLHLRNAPRRELVDRIHRMAEAALALKELDYIGQTRSGRLRERVGHLAKHVLAAVEERHSAGDRTNGIPERVKVLRNLVIRKLESIEANSETTALLDQLSQDMEDLFLVMQLYSYRGDYLVGSPSTERLAETVDKFEEDILGLDYPLVRGSRRVVIRLGEPVNVNRTGRAGETRDLTKTLQSQVQSLVDQLNTRSPRPDPSATMPG